MKFDQLIGNNMRNIFVEKLYTKFAGEIILRPLSKSFLDRKILKNFKQFVSVAC